MAAYLIRTLKAEPFARIKPDPFYRYDEHRPVIDVNAGDLETVDPARRRFLPASIDLEGRTPVILTADEPDLGWYRFADDVFSRVRNPRYRHGHYLGQYVRQCPAHGPNLSAIASSEDLFERLRQRNVYPISYKRAERNPFRDPRRSGRQGTDQPQHLVPLPLLPPGDHPLRVAGLSRRPAVRLWDIAIDTAELEISWDNMSAQIQEMVDKNPEVQDLIRKLRKEKVKGSFADMKSSARNGEKVIHLQDFLEPRTP